MATTTTTTTLTESNSRSVKTTLNYYLDPAKGGHTSYQIGVADYYRRKYDPHPVEIHDIRGRETDFTLDTHGFQHHTHTSVEKDFTDDSQVKSLVYPETAQLIKDVTAATKVHVFSHITRRDSREAAELAISTDPSLQSSTAPYQKVVPARFIHVDFSDAGAEQIFLDNFPEEKARLSRTRWGIINVWRPIRPVFKDPLALCDARTARDEDLIPVTSWLPPKGSGQYASVSAGEGFELYYKRFRAGEEEKWYFAEGMRPEEVLLLKIFDSRRDGRTARRCPHSAFTNPQTEGERVRESIEVRALVFWEDQEL